jgi:hypothetical protein
MLDKEKVWISDPHEGFILGRIVDLTDEGALVEHLEGKRLESTVSFEQVIIQCNFKFIKFSSKFGQAIP